MNARLSAVFVACFSSVALAQNPPAQRGDTWDQFVTRAASEHGELGARAAAFLRRHHPSRDTHVAVDLLLDNLTFALRAREEFAWARDLDEARFFNDVLPYAVLDETRENWRPAMYERARAIVADCDSASQAAQALNRELFDQIGVHYDTGRKQPNQSPSESIAQGRATCTGLSILLIDACRAVGIPARAAGVAKWNGKNGNHTWVEIWDGEWHFTGADEFDAKGLDRAWFTRDAAKAVAGDPAMAVRATSWRPTGEIFRMSWRRRDDSVHGVDVTSRYATDDRSDESLVHLRLWREGQRIARTVRVLAEGEVVATVETRGARADLNDMASVRLDPGQAYLFESVHNGQTRLLATVESSDGATLDLHEFDLTRDSAEEILTNEAHLRLQAIAKARKAELENAKFELGDHELRVLERTFGDAKQGERSLWISMHGGGGTTTAVNDKQWHNQIKLYDLDDGIYVAPRAPTDTWNLWHQAHIDGLFDRMIETYVAARGVDPNRVYLLGYSAGGDGVYQLAPRMADRFAAAAMMAGHPNETQPHGLRNLPFALFMGGKDGAYKRNEIAAKWGEDLAALRQTDPEGYIHRVTIYPDCGHWMNGRDKEGLPWMTKHTRKPWPKRIVWRQDDVVHDRFYWLAVDPAEVEAGDTITASVEGQTITIQSERIHALTLRLRDRLIDLDQPIRVVANDTTVFEGSVPRTHAAIIESLAQRADGATAATATLGVEW